MRKKERTAKLTIGLKNINENTKEYEYTKDWGLVITPVWEPTSSLDEVFHMHKWIHLDIKSSKLMAEWLDGEYIPVCILSKKRKYWYASYCDLYGPNTEYWIELDEILGTDRVKVREEAISFLKELLSSKETYIDFFDWKQREIL